MAEAVVDANVLLGYRLARDQYHERAREIVAGMDRGELPRGQVTNYALVEVLNPIQNRAGDERAAETLEFLRESRGFRVRHLAEEDFERGRALFRRTAGVQLPDLVTVAYMRRRGLEYVYSFDDDFDRFDGITRLTGDTNPFEPSSVRTGHHPLWISSTKKWKREL